jgi:23S rRNA (uracil1939-C5)-methyltransferase
MSCPIAAPAINRALAELRRMAHQPRFPEFLDTIELFTNGEQIQLNILRTTGRRPARSFFDWCASNIPGSDASFLEYQAAGETFRVGHRSFFQVNRFLMDRLVDLALETAEGDSALDLYAGVGLFSLPLARRFSRVAAVESGQGAVYDLKSNAERAGLTIDAHAGQAERFLETITEAPDFVLADPPRAGLGKAAVEQLTRLRPARLTLVSCDPSTLARDLGALLRAGYELEALTLIDLFPQTFHIETVARLRLSR